MDDEQMVEGIKNDDVRIFEQLFKIHYEELTRFAYSFLKDWEAAEEIVQDMFYQFWRKKEQITIEKSVKSYLYQSVKNNCLQVFKHKIVEKKYMNSLKHEGYSASYEQSDNLESKEVQAKIDQILLSLPERCRAIFQLNRFEGLKYAEIAERLEISIKTVEANMGKALKVFRDKFANYLTNNN